MGARAVRFEERLAPKAQDGRTAVRAAGAAPRRDRFGFHPRAFRARVGLGVAAAVFEHSESPFSAVCAFR